MSHLIDLQRLIPTIKKSWDEKILEIDPTFEGIVIELYEKFDIESANKLLMYVVYAYDKDSRFISNKKDRSEVVESIHKFLKTPDNIQKVIQERKEPLYKKVVELVINAQADYRWKQVVRLLTYVELQDKFVSQETNTTKSVKSAVGIEVIDLTDKELMETSLKKAEVIEAIGKANTEAEKLIRQIKEEYQLVDAALESDELPNLTSKLNATWEEWVINENRKNGKI